jgi:hypothetical protein
MEIVFDTQQGGKKALRSSKAWKKENKIKNKEKNKIKALRGCRNYRRSRCTFI